nr:hypothetical protein [Gemmatimonadales bacterium]
MLFRLTLIALLVAFGALILHGAWQTIRTARAAAADDLGAPARAASVRNAAWY